MNASFAGQYESVFKGRGMQFDEVREYMPGDDIRTIDWNVTARTGRPFIKRFVEERELTVMFAVDLSASGEFGTRQQAEERAGGGVLRRPGLRGSQEQRQGGAAHLHRPDRAVHPAQEGQPARAAADPRAARLQMPKRKTDIPLALDYMARVMRKGDGVRGLGLPRRVTSR